MKGKKPERRGLRTIVIVIGLVLLATMVMDFNSRMADLHRLSEERERVSQELLSYTQTQAALKADIAYATSEAAVAEWAYQNGHMIRPGDLPVVPIVSEQVTPTPTPRPVVTPTVVANWERWMALFFGPRTP